ALGEARPAGVPDADDGDLLGEGPRVGGDDDLAALDAHRAALDRRARAERDDAGPARRADRREHPGAVPGADEVHRPVVEEGGEPAARVARVAGPVEPGSRRRGDRRRGLVRLSGHQALVMTRATLCPPKPKLLLSAATSPLGRDRCSPWTTSSA